MKNLIPRKTRSFKAICKLPFDNIHIGDYYIMIDETTVSLDEERKGEYPRQTIQIPRKVFDKFIDWYNTGKIPREEKRKAEYE